MNKFALRITAVTTSTMMSMINASPSNPITFAHPSPNKYFTVEKSSSQLY
jgi:hypothetical protein